MFKKYMEAYKEKPQPAKYVQCVGERAVLSSRQKNSESYIQINANNRIGRENV